MPQFNPGQSKNAVVPVTVQPSGLSCEIEVFLGPNDTTKVATSGLLPFTSTGSQQGIVAPITMPSASGTYHVFIDVYSGDFLIAAYQAIEDVVIAPVGVAEFTYVSSVRHAGTILYPGDLGNGIYDKIQVDIKNTGTGAGICHPHGFMRFVLYDRTIISEGSYGWYLYENPNYFPGGYSPKYFNKPNPAPTFDLEPGQVATFEWHLALAESFRNVYTWAESEAGKTEELRLR